jgi:ABC-type bacteriocin/lantibiotic exporter with double-glycine peptidase domain
VVIRCASEAFLLTQKQTVIAGAFFVMCFAVVVKGSPGLWLDVPYVHQEKDGCGSASLAMILRYWQRKNVPVADGRADPVKIQRELYAATAKGIYASQMERYLRESGFDVYALRGEWSDLRTQVAKGRPLIAALKPKGEPAHYVVIVGIAPGDAEVLEHDPERGKLIHMGRTEFEKSWRGTENWTLLAVPHRAE